MALIFERDGQAIAFENMDEQDELPIGYVGIDEGDSNQGSFTYYLSIGEVRELVDYLEKQLDSVK